MFARKLVVFALIASMLTLCACAPQLGASGQSLSPIKTAAGSGGQADAGGENFNPAGMPIVNDKITLSVTQCVRDVDDLNFETMQFYQDLEEKTNIHIDWNIIKQADWKTKLNLMFASAEYTDIIIGGSNGELDCDEYGANQKILVPLDDYFEAYMPLYNERLQMDNVNDSLPASDGKSYFIGYFRAEGINTSGHYFINTTWLDRLGMQVPTTVNQLTDTLRRFKTDDPNQNGKQDEVPYESMFTGTMAGLVLVFPFWGIPVEAEYVMIDDSDKVQFVGSQPGFREACEWLNLIYSEGLVDPECITQDQSVYAAKLNSGTIGFFPYWRLETVGIVDEVVEEFDVCLPVSAEGYSAKMSRRIELPKFGAALTTACKEIPAALRWLDCQLEAETMIGSIPGLQNIFLNEEGKWETAEEPETLENAVPGVNGIYFAPATWYFNNYKFGWNIQEKAEHCAWYEESGVMEKMSSYYATKIAKMSTEEKTELALLQTEIVKFMEESITSFMVSGVTDANWQTFENTFARVNVAKYLELYQNAYDSYRAR